MYVRDLLGAEVEPLASFSSSFSSNAPQSPQSPEPPRTSRRQPHPRTKHLTRDQRLQIHTLKSAGLGLPAITKQIGGVTYRQVQYAASQPISPKKRPSRPGKLTEAQTDELEVFVVSSKTGRLMSYLHLSMEFLQFDAGADAFKYALEKRGFHQRVARQKPPLSEKNQADRLAFAEAHKDWTREQWCLILWSDESWVQGGRHRKQWVNRRKGEVFNPTCLLTKIPKKQGWMFWGCFHEGTKGPGLFWEKDWGTITRESYREHTVPVVLEYIIMEHPELSFMQDNAPSHKDQDTRWLLNHLGINTIF